MHSSRRSPPRVARCRAAHRPNGPSIPLAQPCRIEHETALFGRAVKRHALRLLGWAAVPIGPCARTCTRQHTDAARAQLRVARALSAAAAAAAGMLLLLPIPPGGPQPPGAASESRGGSNPVVPSFVRCCPARNFGMRALATACSGADDLRLSERSSSRKCSDCRQSQAASKGLERDAICETEESEAAGAGSTKGRREAERCMWGWGKGLGWDFLRLPWLT